MKRIIMFVIMFILSINLVLGISFRIEHPDFFGVNETETVWVHADETITNESAWIFIDGEISNMTLANPNSWYVNLIGTSETNTSYIIQVLDSSIEHINGSDNIRDSEVTIDNSSLYGFVNYSIVDEEFGEIENNAVCVYMKRIIGSPTVRGFIGNQNETSTNITFNYGDEISIINNIYDNICFDVNYIYSDNYTNIIEYAGFECTNCDSLNKIKLGLDTTTVNNLSIVLANDTNYTIDYINNFMIQLIEWEGNTLEHFDGEFYFREPYYITFEFYYGVNQTTKEQRRYENVFDYVYLYEYNNTNTSGIQTPAFLGGIIEIVALVPGTESFYDDDRYVYDSDIETFFWADYDSTAIVKLYELSWHKLNIMGSDVKVDGATFDEFNKPVVSSNRWQTQITNLDLYNLLGGNKTNTTLKVYVQPWEANKSQFMLDIFKWILVLGVLFLIIMVEVGLGVDGKAIGYTIIAYMALMGGIGWVV